MLSSDTDNGDIVKKAMSLDFDPDASAFFMATALRFRVG